MLRRAGKKKKKCKLKLIIFLSLFIFLLIIADKQIRPLVKSVAENQAKIVATNLINEEILRELSEKSSYYSEFVFLKTDNNGKLLAINTDSQKVNILKSSISSNIQKKMPSTTPIKAAVPLGTLTGVELFMGRGPTINMKMSVPGCVLTDIKSEFVQAGINQTKHRIYIYVETQVYALIPGFPVATTVSTTVLISETVIVGDIPNVYADMNSSNTSALSGLSQVANSN